MRRSILLVLLFAWACMFASCGNIEFNIEDNIKPPVKDKSPLQGTWKVERYISVKKEHKTEQVADVGMTALFDNDISAVGRQVCVNPEYKIIRTSADSFIQSRYRVEEEVLGLQNETANVVTIASDNQLFCEVIEIDRTSAYIFKENGFLVLRKISDSIDQKLKDSCYGYAGMNVDSDEYKEDPLLRSGVLIGVRASDNTYRTLWIYSKNREVKTASLRQQIMVPRAKGFWEIGVDEKTGSQEQIYAKPFTDLPAQPALPGNIRQNALSEKMDAKILFVGNDFIGIEHNLRYSVFSMDELSQQKELPLSEFVTNGYNLLQAFGQEFIATQEDEIAKNLIRQTDEDNFTLKRRNGHWIMKSRLYYKESIKNDSFEEFDLNLMVPSKLIHYDDMDIPWNEIKSRLPWITDAYMSPNKDIAILVSEGSLNIYPVQNRSIVNKQLMKIPLSKGDTIVMTEWAIGRYADIWATFASKSFSAIK